MNIEEIKAETRAEENKTEEKKPSYRFKESLCRADEYGRPVMYWDPNKKERYVMQVAEKGQSCQIVRELKKGMVEVEFTVVVNVPDGKGNRISKAKKEKVHKDMLEVAE